MKILKVIVDKLPHCAHCCDFYRVDITVAGDEQYAWCDLTGKDVEGDYDFEIYIMEHICPFCPLVEEADEAQE